jgi:uncharacterized phiE125 gp8 family phage protein
MAELGAADLAAAREAVKLQVRIATAGEDAIVAQLARTAVSLCEAFCGQILVARAAEEVIGATRDWRRLAAEPVSAITGVDGLPAEGAAFPLAVGRYAVDIDDDGIGRVRVIDAGIAGRVRVTYAAGLAPSWAQLPPPLAQGIVCLAAHLYVHRTEAAEVAPPAAVAALWRPWRRLEVAA